MRCPSGYALRCPQRLAATACCWRSEHTHPQNFSPCRICPLTFQSVERVSFFPDTIVEGGTAMERPLTVGQLAHATGVPAKTIRYYEQVGVLPAPQRSGAGYRHYSRHDVHRLLFIRRARALGLSLANLKALTAELDRGEEVMRSAMGLLGLVLALAIGMFVYR